MPSSSTHPTNVGGPFSSSERWTWNARWSWTGEAIHEIPTARSRAARPVMTGTGGGVRFDQASTGVLVLRGGTAALPLVEVLRRVVRTDPVAVADRRASGTVVSSVQAWPSWLLRVAAFTALTWATRRNTHGMSWSFGASGRGRTPRGRSDRPRRPAPGSTPRRHGCASRRLPLPRRWSDTEVEWCRGPGRFRGFSAEEALLSALATLEPVGCYEVPRHPAQLFAGLGQELPNGDRVAGRLASLRR